VKTYTSLLYAFLNTKQVDAAHTLYTQLKGKNFVFDDVFLRVLLKVFRSGKKQEWIDEVVNDQREKREAALEERVKKVEAERTKEEEEERSRTEMKEKKRMDMAKRYATKQGHDRNGELTGKPEWSNAEKESDTGRPHKNGIHSSKEKATNTPPQSQQPHSPKVEKDQNLLEGEENDGERDDAVTTNTDTTKYDFGIFSEDDETAFKPEIGNKLFEMAVQRHKQEAEARLSQKPQQPQQPPQQPQPQQPQQPLDQRNKYKKATTPTNTTTAKPNTTRIQPPQALLDLEPSPPPLPNRNISSPPPPRPELPLEKLLKKKSFK
jgi:pentatricopeptide repeat protein